MTLPEFCEHSLKTPLTCPVCLMIYIQELQNELDSLKADRNRRTCVHVNVAGDCSLQSKAKLLDFLEEHSLDLQCRPNHKDNVSEVIWVVCDHFSTQDTIISFDSTPKEAISRAREKMKSELITQKAPVLEEGMRGN